MFSRTLTRIGRLLKVRLSPTRCTAKQSLLVFVLVVVGTKLLLREKLPSSRDIYLSEDIIEFDQEFKWDRFDNETGADHFVVPNIIHFIRFNQSEITFVDYICIQSAFRNQKPDYIYIHTDVSVDQFKGKYWNLIVRDSDLFARIRIKYLEVPSEIFGQELSKEWRLWHGSDIARIRIVMKYGGIYLDNDMYVIRSLDKYRKFEATVSWRSNDLLGNQVIIANRHARVLPLWLATYKNYRADLW